MRGEAEAAHGFLDAPLVVEVLGKDKNASRMVYGVASLPLGAPVELEVIFEVTTSN